MYSKVDECSDKPHEKVFQFWCFCGDCGDLKSMANLQFMEFLPWYKQPILIPMVSNTDALSCPILRILTQKATFSGCRRCIHSTCDVASLENTSSVKVTLTLTSFNFNVDFRFHTGHERQSPGRTSCVFWLKCHLSLEPYAGFLTLFVCCSERLILLQMGFNWSGLQAWMDEKLVCKYQVPNVGIWHSGSETGQIQMVIHW